MATTWKRRPMTFSEAKRWSVPWSDAQDFFVRAYEAKHGKIVVADDPVAKPKKSPSGE